MADNRNIMMRLDEGVREVSSPKKLSGVTFPPGIAPTWDRPCHPVGVRSGAPLG